jgi:hypothetical protein
MNYSKKEMRCKSDSWSAYYDQHKIKILLQVTPPECPEGVDGLWVIILNITSCRFIEVEQTLHFTGQTGQKTWESKTS